MTTINNKGFALIGLLISVVIIAILVMLYYRRSDNGRPSPNEVNQKAIEDAKDASARTRQTQIEIQNELNSIGR